MQNRDDIHGIQAGILRQLFYKDKLRFAEINVDNVSSDHFSYHLRQLIKHGLIEKADDNTYNLSVLGRSRAIMLYPNRAGFIEQGFLAVRLVLSREHNGERQFLMQKRRIVPYKGTYATPGDKVLFGEDIADAAARAMKEGTGLECDFRSCGLIHIKDTYKDKIVQDKYFFVFTASNPRGEMKQEGRSGDNMWLSYDEIKNSGLSLQGNLEIVDMSQRGGWEFIETTYTVESY